MANEINIALDPVSQSGLTVIARLYASGAQVGSDISLSEVGSSAFYTGDAPSGLSAGSYAVSFHDDDDDALLGTGELVWDGEQEVDDARLANLDVAVSSRLAASSYTAPDNDGIADAKTAAQSAASAAAAAQSAAEDAESAAASVDAKLTDERAANLDNLDALVSSRLAASSYTAPDNDGIADAKTASQSAAASAASVDGKLTTQRASNLDNLDVAVSDTLETLSDQLDQVKAAIAARSPLPVNSPESAGAILETVRGDDHTDDSPHGAYVWDAPASTWGDLSSATIKFTSRRASDDVAEIDGYSAGFSVLDAGTEDQKVKLELPASETSKLTPGANGAKLTNKFDVQVTRADDVTFTLARGVPPLGGHTIYEDQTRDESS